MGCCCCVRGQEATDQEELPGHETREPQHPAPAGTMSAGSGTAMGAGTLTRTATSTREKASRPEGITGSNRTSGV